MDTKKDVAKWLKHYTELFTLQEWQIDLVHGVCPEPYEERAGCVETNEEYKYAKMHINLKQLQGHRLGLRDLIKHELLHLVHSEYDTLFMDALKHIEDMNVVDCLHTQRAHIVERLVTKLERLVK